MSVDLKRFALLPAWVITLLTGAPLLFVPGASPLEYNCSAFPDLATVALFVAFATGLLWTWSLILNVGARRTNKDRALLGALLVTSGVVLSASYPLTYCATEAAEPLIALLVCIGLVANIVATWSAASALCEWEQFNAPSRAGSRFLTTLALWYLPIGVWVLRPRLAELANR